MYFVFAYNEHMALGGSEDCQGIFDNFPDALIKAIQIIDAFEDVNVETIKDNKFELIVYKSNGFFINGEEIKITIDGWDAMIEMDNQKWDIELNQPNKRIIDLILDKLANKRNDVAGF